jgi:Concanavalin A-like lectin/glucanases superfamily
MRVGVVVLLGACGFSPHEAAPIDALTDSPSPPADVCANAVLCLPFDQAPLTTSLADSGTASFTASLLNVTTISGVTGDAALLSSTSEIYVPNTAALAGILAYDYWIRIDTPPDPSSRTGILDTAAPDGIDAFYFTNLDGTAQIRCYLDSFVPLYATVAPFHGWTHVACSCEAQVLSIYVNGVQVASQNVQCGPGMVADPGLEVGADNNPGGQGTQDDVLVGAIDDVRMYTAPLSPDQVCHLAGTC